MLAAETKCAVHVDAVALAACSRCGAFFCATCRVEAAQPLCVACKDRLELPLAVRYRPFDVGRSLNGAFSILGGTWVQLVLVSLPFGLGAGAMDVLVVPAANGTTSVAFAQAAIAGVAASLYSAIVGLYGNFAALSLSVARAEGRTQSTGGAFREAGEAWRRGVGVSLMTLMQVLGYSLLCGLPGVYRSVQLAFTNVLVFFKRDEAPLNESEALGKEKIWELLAFLLIAILITFGPVFAVNATVGVMVKISHLPRPISLFMSGVTGQLARSLMAPFVVAAFYGLTVSKNLPAPLRR